MTAFLAQFRTELVLTLRRGESLLLILGLPLLFLVFFSQVDVLPVGEDEPIEFLAPGIMALAVMSTAMVSLSISTGFERSYGVLKRLGSTPLGRPRLVAAKTAAVVAIELVQFVLLVSVAVLLGWDASGDWGAALLAVALGTVAFAGLGLVLAGRLRAEVNLAAANGLYLVLLLVSGMAFSLDELPEWLRAVSRVAAIRRAHRGAPGRVHRRPHSRAGVGSAGGVGGGGPGARSPALPLGVSGRGSGRVSAGVRARAPDSSARTPPAPRRRSARRHRGRRSRRSGSGRPGGSCCSRRSWPRTA